MAAATAPPEAPTEYSLRMGWEFVGADRMPMIYDPSACPELQEEQDIVIRALEQYCTDNQVSADEAATRKGSEVQREARATIAARRALLQQEQGEQEGEEDARRKAEEEEVKEAARQKKERDIDMMLTTGPLADTVRVLHTQRGAKVYLLGTAHVSMMVELCHRRLGVIKEEPSIKSKEEKEAELSGLYAGLFDALKRGCDGSVITSLALEIFVLVGSKNIDTPNGYEFRVAAMEGLRAGAVIILGDRDEFVTVGRLWAQVSLFEFAKVAAFLGWTMLTGRGQSPTVDEVEGMTSVDAIEDTVEVAKSMFPSAAAAFMDERDQFLSDRCCPGDTIVAVVGKAHMTGIEQHWQTEVNRAALLEVPEPKPGVAARAVSWCFSTTLGALCWTVGLFLPRGDQAAVEKKAQ